MAVATSQLKIQLEGAKSISDLEAVLQEVNGQLKDVDINSDSFKELSTVAKTANASVREIQTSLEGVTGAQQADAAFKLGEALVGGFAIATVASSIFGEETGKSVEEATAAAAQLLVALDGVKKISEAFTSENIKGLKGIVQGFKASTIGAKLFGTTTKAALTATGIGILVIAVGLLVANFDAVVKAVRNFADSVPFLKGIVDTIDGLIDSVGSLGNLFSALGAGIKGLFTAGTSAAEEFKKALKEGNELIKINAKLDEFNKNTKRELEQTVRLLEAQGASADRILRAKRNLLQSELDILRGIKEQTDNQKERIDIILFDLELLDTKKVETTKVLGVEKGITAEKEDQNKLSQEALDILRAEETLRDKLSKQQRDALTDQEKFRDDNQFIIDLINSDIIGNVRDAKDAELLPTIPNTVENLKLLEQQLIETRDANLALFKSETGEKDSIGKFASEAEQRYIRAAIAANELRPIIKQLDDERIEAQREFNKLIEEESNTINRDIDDKLNSDFQSQLDKTAQKIRDAQDAVFNYGFAAVDALGVVAQFVRNDIDRIATELDKINVKAEESAERRSSLEDQLKDAAGDRFDFILKKLQQEQAREKILQEQKLKQEGELREAKTKAAQLEKAQAVANSIVQTILATIQALPNLILAGIVGSIGAAATIAIGATPIPEFAEGGYTGKGLGFKDGSGEQVAGVVHSDEYVVPKHIVNSAQGSKMISSLEAMRLGMKGYAEGGSVGIPDTGGNGQAQLSASQLVNALSSARFQVAVSEFNRVSNEVSVIEDNSSF